MTGCHRGLGWPGAIGDQAREATAPPYTGRHHYGAPVELGWNITFDPRRCEDCGHLEDRCDCPHDCTYPEDIS